MVCHQVGDSDLRTRTVRNAILVHNGGAVWAHNGRTAGEDSWAGDARREPRSSRATFVLVMQPADVGDGDDRAIGWRLGSSVDGRASLSSER
jgi:hypothetical protein